MITVYNAMLVLLGTLLAALAVLFLMPAYKRRVERFTTERIKRALPLTENEIRADKDRIRAEYAIEVHKLGMKLEEATLGAARQSVEINRRDARVNELENLLQSQKGNVEEHQNARRVLEQTILDRLPKVEARLGEARRMLLQRDGEIASLTRSSSRQEEALEQATQINVQLTQEAQRLRAALETRAARNREAIGDPRFDGEVALRTEIEALRAKSQEQAQMIERLQTADTEAEFDTDTAKDRSALNTQAAEIERLTTELAKVEAELLVLQSASTTTEHMAELEDENRAQLSEIARLMAQLRSYEEAAASRNEADALAAKAEIGSLQTIVDEQKHTIEALRAEVAASTERLSRQAQHYRDEMHRLSVQASEGEKPPASDVGGDVPRRSLAERIAQPRIPGRVVELNVEVVRAASNTANGDGARETRGAAFLKAVNGGAEASSDEDRGEAAEAAPAPRRARLLERISNIDKSG